ncbi:MAG: enolase C-terminal domain-like protein [Litorilinea sp.]
MTASLHFTQFRVWEVVVPARADIIAAPDKSGRIYSDSTKWPERAVHLVEGTTNTGIVAVGEANRGVTRPVVEATLQDLLGRDLLTTAPATLWMTSEEPDGLPVVYPKWSWHNAPDKEYMLMEALWLDAVGKAVGLPAHQLLGGAVRKVVPTDFWANRPDPKTLAALIHEAAENGLHGIKMKCNGAGDMVHAVVQIAEDIPAGFRVTIDPMYAWRSFRESYGYFEMLASLPFTVQIEDPFIVDALDDWHRARSVGGLTIICHPRREELFRIALREDIADGYNLGGGSTYEFIRSSAVAEFHYKDCWHGSSLELGVLQHLRLHAAACARNCVLGSDLQSEWVREATLITPHMQYADGGAIVPDRPGLGVDLDHAAMQPYTRSTFQLAQ